MKRLKPFILYHWSPSFRRKQIIRHGLRIGCRVVQHSKGWKPTYLCFSDSPSLAWGLSGALAQEPGEWDLWMVWSNNLESLWRLERPAPPHHLKRPTEWRTKHPVPKRHLWHVGVRRAKD